MAYFVYSTEGFPGGPGRDHEFARVKGVQVIIPARQWLKLNQFYLKSEQGLYKDLKGSPLVSKYTAQQIAEWLVEKYAFIGLVTTTSEQDMVRAKLEKDSEEVNRKHRKKVINEFENERRKAIMRGGVGRVEASAYEEDCYRVLGIPIPTEPAAIESKREMLKRDSDI